jgi:hypothetical protein
MNDKMQMEKRKKREISVPIKKIRIPGQKKPLLIRHMPCSGVLPLSN